jgi:antitoxin VapB
MGFTITSPEAQRLAKELSELAGESLTEAVTEALRERLARLHGDKGSGGVADRLLTIGRRTAANLKEPDESVDHAEVLYDKHGLPR